MAVDALGAGRSSRERRALNMIWTAAGDYHVQPLFAAYSKQGEPDLYFNTIIGSAYRLYGAQALDKYLLGLGRSFMGAMLVDLFWLGLEAAVFVRQRESYAALGALRRGWAADYVDTSVEDSMQALMLRQEIVHSMKTVRCQELLGQKSSLLNPWEKGLYAGLSFAPALNLSELVQHFKELIKKYFLFSPQVLLSPKKWRLTFGSRLGELFNRFLPMQRQSSVSQTSMARTLLALGKSQKEQNSKLVLLGKSSALKEWQNIRKEFPQALLARQDCMEIELATCVEAHQLCHVYFAKGGKAVAANTVHFHAHQRRYRLLIDRLTHGLANSLQLAKSSYENMAHYGSLQARLVWQTKVTDEAKIFCQRSEESWQDFTVVLLLDGSYSRHSQQTALAAQSYIIAESMTRCNIPVQVLSYCSMDSYTILELLKDTHESSSGAFGYQARGWNRDGLAFRALGEYFSHKQMKNVLLFILSDIMPSDERGIPIANTKLSKQYTEEAALKDTEEAAKSLRKQGIHLAGIIQTVAPFAPATAHRIFGRSYVHIDKLDKLSNAVVSIVDGYVQRSI